jgi:DNA polymerase
VNREEARLRELGLWPSHGLVRRSCSANKPPSAAPAPSPDGQLDQRLVISTLDWTPLEAAIRSCEACGLCRTRRQAVPGTGSRTARVLVVGEAPGAEEDQRGEPFVGRAGELLDQMLLAVGLDRRRVYIANVLKCRPPENRDPTPDEVAACSPFLRRQILLLQPAVILALGSFAARALLGGEGKVGALRGGSHLYEGIPVLVSYHPAYLLRSPKEKLRTWEDLCRLQDVLVGAFGAPGVEAELADTVRAVPVTLDPGR